MVSYKETTWLLFMPIPLPYPPSFSPLRSGHIQIFVTVKKEDIMLPWKVLKLILCITYVLGIKASLVPAVYQL